MYFDAAREYVKTASVCDEYKKLVSSLLNVLEHGEDKKKGLEWELSAPEYDELVHLRVEGCPAGNILAILILINPPKAND